MGKRDADDEAEGSASAVVGTAGNEAAGNEDAVGNEGAESDEFDESPKHAEGAASNVEVAPETAPVPKGGASKDAGGALWKGRLDPNKEDSAPL